LFACLAAIAHIVTHLTKGNFNSDCNIRVNLGRGNVIDNTEILLSAFLDEMPPFNLTGINAIDNIQAQNDTLLDEIPAGSATEKVCLVGLRVCRHRSRNARPQNIEAIRSCEIVRLVIFD